MPLTSRILTFNSFNRPRTAGVASVAYLDLFVSSDRTAGSGLAGCVCSASGSGCEGAGVAGSSVVVVVVGGLSSGYFPSSTSISHRAYRLGENMLQTRRPFTIQEWDLSYHPRWDSVICLEMKLLDDTFVSRSDLKREIMVNRTSLNALEATYIIDGLI